MRIAIYQNLPSGGAKRAVFEWTRRLANEHTIDVYSLETADHAFCDIRSFVSQYNVYEFTPRNLFKTPFGRLNQLQRWRDLDDLERLNRQIAAQINAGSYDVLFANPCKFTFIPALLQYIEIPSLYYLHEPFGPGFFRHFERSYLPKAHWRETFNRFDPLIWLYHHKLGSMQKQSMLKTKTLLANSQFTSECNQAVFGRPASFCPLGVDFNDFQPMPSASREDFVVSVGEMSPRKGFDFVIESLGTIPIAQRPALKLACNVINSDELGYVKNLAGRNGVDLEVLSNLGINELRLLYSRARLCIYAPVMEPFGLVPLEAMACGTPVVGVREGGVPESVVHEQTGLVVERDTQKFGAAIQYMLENKDLAETYGCNAREHVTQNWTWEKSVSVLMSYLEMCVSLAQ